MQTAYISRIPNFDYDHQTLEWKIDEIKTYGKGSEICPIDLNIQNQQEYCNIGSRVTGFKYGCNVFGARRRRRSAWAIH